MQLRDRLRSVPRRRRLAAVAVLAVVVGTAGVVATQRSNEPDSAGPRSESSASATGASDPVVVSKGPASAVSDGFEAATLAAGGWKTGGSGAALAKGGDQARTGRQALRLEVGADATRRTTLRRARVPVGQGLGCDVGAWARGVTGDQRLVVVFLGSDGRQLSSSEGAAADTGSRVWSRATVRATSPKGTTALEVRITAEPGSSGRWDDLDITCPLLPDAGFERADGPTPDRPAGWLVTAGGGASARRVAVAGAAHVLEVRDTSRTQGVTVRSQPTPVPPGLEVEVSGRVQRTEGDQQVVVRFLDSAKHPRGEPQVLPVASAIDRGERWAKVVSVPTLARWATLEITSGPGARSTARWDDLDVRPVDAAGGRLGPAKPVSSLGGYVNTSTSGTVTVAGRALLYTVVSGDPAELQVADLATGELVDRRVVPGAPTSWGLATAPDQRTVYVAGASGHLLAYDPGSKTLTDLGRATPRASVIFGLVVAPDGRVWGGSYPGGELWTFTPRTRRFSSIAPLRDGREYARSLAIQGQTLFVGTGSVDPGIVAVNMRDPAERREIALPGAPGSGFVTELRVYGRLLAAKLPDGTRGVYDLQRNSWDTPVSKDATGRQLTQSPSTVPAGQPFYYFSNGLLWRVRPDLPDETAKTPVATSAIPPGRDRFVLRATLDGTTSDWLVSYDGSRGVVAIDVGALADGVAGKDVPEARWIRTSLRLDPRPLRIKSLGAGSDGVLWAGGFGGASLSSLDARESTPSLTPRVGGAGSDVALLGFGEVEGLAPNGPYEFFGTYTGARIFRFDTRRPWVDGKNPALVAHLGPSWGQDRPGAWATSSDRTYFGTIPRYGRRGGVLGWFDGDRTEPTVVPSPVPDQSIVGLAASGTVVYGTTSRWGGLGISPTGAGAVAFAYDTRERRVLWTAAPRPGLQSAGSIVLAGDGSLFVLMRTELVELDRTDGHVIRRFPLGTASGGERATFADTDLAEGGGRLWAATSGGVWAVDPGTGSFTQVVGSGVLFARVEFLADAAYFPAGQTLMKVALP